MVILTGLIAFLWGYIFRGLMDDSNEYRAYTDDNGEVKFKKSSK